MSIITGTLIDNQEFKKYLNDLNNVQLGIVLKGDQLFKNYLNTLSSSQLDAVLRQLKNISVRTNQEVLSIISIEDAVYEFKAKRIFNLFQTFCLCHKQKVAQLPLNIMGLIFHYINLDVQKERYKN